jgi:hypothetical protein
MMLQIRHLKDEQFQEFESVQHAPCRVCVAFRSRNKIGTITPAARAQFSLTFATGAEVRHSQQPLDPIALPNGPMLNKMVAYDWQNQQPDTRTDLSTLRLKVQVS